MSFSEGNPQISLFFPNTITNTTEFFYLFCVVICKCHFPLDCKIYRADLVFVFALFNLSTLHSACHTVDAQELFADCLQRLRRCSMRASMPFKHFLVGTLNRAPLVVSLRIHYKRINLFHLPVDFRMVVSYNSQTYNNEIEVLKIMSSFWKYFIYSITLITWNLPKFYITCSWLSRNFTF